ncbi:PREDICTED: uncharacterized protein LOC105975244 [Erythranthe guttata]|uniref:uncharacterized protein LOC105975244 n=1 Tax=Erythranthe guttata TaxID=4155 RepID=UPI00064DDBEC|nr:PREDICTED: uncharacterized protein LOC105975244 [Erythranthe guttata]|eukprot:XP_012855875.1 PREDICTED: uncharacterized protein LOC105975244 [Erythranthe guttata]
MQKYLWSATRVEILVIQWRHRIRRACRLKRRCSGRSCGEILNLLHECCGMRSVVKQRFRPSYSTSYPRGKDGKLISSHKWKTSKKSPSGAQILDLFHAPDPFCLWQAILTGITTFSSILRVLWIHYD